MATRWRAVQFFGDHLPSITSGNLASILDIVGIAYVTYNGPSEIKLE